jgi:hypothetical protein
MIFELPDEPNGFTYGMMVYIPKLKFNDGDIIPERTGLIKGETDRTLIIQVNHQTISIDKTLYCVDFFTATHFNWFTALGLKHGYAQAYKAVGDQLPDLKPFLLMVLKLQSPITWLNVKNK